MSENTATEDDPLVLLRPPTTDHATYLTMLEYHLSPNNLPLLNGLLQDNRTNLAEDIGWDLLRLILPMFSAENTENVEVERCLALIARRGNPREVVVSVAAELERISQKMVDIKDDTDAEADGQNPAASEAASTQSTTKQCVSLVKMLKVVHPRIRTNYPSRFLATSLPAVIAALRTVPGSMPLMKAITGLLDTLSGRQRPSLPPRNATSANTTALIANPTSIDTAEVSLPDPEAVDNIEETSNNVSTLEQALRLRLLQAALLEMVEAVVSSMEELDRGNSGVTTTSQEANSSILQRDRKLVIFNLFSESASTLGLDLCEALQEHVETIERRAQAGEDSDNTSQETSDYPTTVSQIGFSLAGLADLYTAEILMIKPDSQRPTMKLAARLLIVTNHPDFISPETSYLPAHVIDTCLSIGQEAMDTRLESWVELPEELFVDLMESLCQIFKTSIDANIRDRALGVATHLLHAYPKMQVRLSLIRKMAQNLDLDEIETMTFMKPTVVMNGALKAVGVEWLKEELLIVLDKLIPTAETPAQAGNIQSTAAPDLVEGLPLAILTDTTAGMFQILFPTLDTEFLSTTPNDLSGNELAHLHFEEFLDDTAAYIRVVNLLAILVTRSMISGARQDLVEVITALLSNPHIREFTSNLSSCLKWSLDGMVAEVFNLNDAQRLNLWSLEDALNRLHSAIAKKDGTTETA